jgi:rubredoxin
MKDTAPEPMTPTSCPTCLSGNIKAPDQMGKGLSYWRCLKCGVVWNPERSPDSSSSSAARSNSRSARRSDLDDYFKNR